jgi:hypothetical protein
MAMTSEMKRGNFYGVRLMAAACGLTGPARHESWAGAAIGQDQSFHSAGSVAERLHSGALLFTMRRLQPLSQMFLRLGARRSCLGSSASDLASHLAHLLSQQMVYRPGTLLYRR